MADKSIELNELQLEHVADTFADAIAGTEPPTPEYPDKSAELNNATLRHVAEVFAEAVGGITPSQEAIDQAVAAWF